VFDLIESTSFILLDIQKEEEGGRDSFNKQHTMAKRASAYCLLLPCYFSLLLIRAPPPPLGGPTSQSQRAPPIIRDHPAIPSSYQASIRSRLHFHSPGVRRPFLGECELMGLIGWMDGYMRQWGAGPTISTVR